jgi:hypothetical protein
MGVSDAWEAGEKVTDLLRKAEDQIDQADDELSNILRRLEQAEDDYEELVGWLRNTIWGIESEYVDPNEPDCDWRDIQWIAFKLRDFIGESSAEYEAPNDLPFI